MPEPEVGVPGAIVEAEATDLATPTDDLLVRLELLPKEGEQDVGPFSGTPYSLQVITAGALEINKVAVAIIASLGGVSVIAAWFEAFWEEEEDPVRITLLVGLAILLSAFALAIAMIVRSDVGARAEASAAQYHARAEVAKAYLRLVETRSPATTAAPSHCPDCPPPTVDPPPNIDPSLISLAAHQVLTITGDDIPAGAIVSGVRKLSDGTIELLTASDWVPASRVSTFSLIAPPPPAEPGSPSAAST